MSVRHRAGLVASVIGSLVLAGGCDSGTETAATPPKTAPTVSSALTTEVVQTVVVQTTAASLAPSETDSVAVSATTIPATTPTTVAPTTTLATTPPPTGTPTTLPAEPANSGTLEEQVLAAVEGAYSVWRECVRAIPTCDPATLAEFRMGAVLAGNEEQLARWRTNNQEAIDVDSYQYEVLEVSLDTDPVYVLVCERDSSWIVERVPGQPERVVADGHVEAIREAQLRLTPDGWKLASFPKLEEVRDVPGALCG